MATLSKSLWKCSSNSAIFRAVSRVKSTGEELTGHSDVLLAQQLVRTRKEELRGWRQKLTEATDSYEQVQRRLKGLYARKAQVYQDHRRDLSAIQTVNDEEESLLVLEQTCFLDLENCQRNERECFERLSDTIQESHEKERAKTDQMKYYSRLGSLMGAVLGFLGSNLFLRREVRQNNIRQAEKMESIKSTLLQMQSQETRLSRNASDDVGVASSSQEDTKQATPQESDCSLQVESMLSELSEIVKRNTLILENICTSLNLQVPQSAGVVTPSELTSPYLRNSQSQNSNMIALAGVVTYSVLLALISLYR